MENRRKNIKSNGIICSIDVVGRAEEAINDYLSVFKNSTMGTIIRYGAEQDPDKEGTVMFAVGSRKNLASPG